MNDFTQLEVKGLEDLKYVRQKFLHKAKYQKVLFSGAMEYLINTATPADIPKLHQLYLDLK